MKRTWILWAVALIGVPLAGELIETIGFHFIQDYLAIPSHLTAEFVNDETAPRILLFMAANLGIIYLLYFLIGYFSARIIKRKEILVVVLAYLMSEVINSLFNLNKSAKSFSLSLEIWPLLVCLIGGTLARYLRRRQERRTTQQGVRSKTGEELSLTL
ncbi:MAG: hypothetical protein IPN90_01845 [Elusimicrobia bacterium]|nr:hypothetical protein [Elusimicrobiota bacterium]